jgi:hypothetical protein
MEMEECCGKLRGKAGFSPFSPSPIPSPFSPSHLTTFSGFRQALKSYILIMIDSSRKTFYSSSCKKGNKRCF